ncbi:MAG: YaiO family outer membrane beta-barrel protein [Flavobacteriia bacterium]|nr:YaiO family outer membrane beta-barrel protein [Flavobacteriia bacterium]
MRSICALFFLAISTLGVAQVNVDSLFRHAQNLSWQNHRQEAIEELNQVIELAPDYLGAHVHLARVYGWEAEYDKGLEAIHNALQLDSSYTEAWEVNVDLLIWSSRGNEAVEVARLALQHIDQNTENRKREAAILRARALIAAGDHEEALEILEPIDHYEAHQLRLFIYQRQNYDYVEVRSSAEYFTDVFDPMYYTSIEGKYNVAPDHGIVARFNTAQRFNQWGTQGEVDYYMAFNRRLSGYVNYGYSPTNTVFPEHRAGAELYYYPFPIGIYRLSGGVRYMYFDQGNDVTIYTAGISVIANFEVTLRTFITPTDEGTNFAWNLFSRFSGGERHFFVFSGTYGFSPDPRRIQVGAGNQVAILQNTQASLEWRYRVNLDWILLAGYNYTYQERPSVESEFYSIHSPTLGIRYTF